MISLVIVFLLGSLSFSILNMSSYSFLAYKVFTEKSTAALLKLPYMLIAYFLLLLSKGLGVLTV
jgi:hypothetical protein